MCSYFRERYLRRIDPAKSIPALRIKFRALLRYLPSVAPNLTTNSVLKNVKSQDAFKQISEWDIFMLATVSIACCSAEIM